VRGRQVGGQGSRGCLCHSNQREGEKTRELSRTFLDSLIESTVEVEVANDFLLFFSIS
jgi:hypothetical protein